MLEDDKTDGLVVRVLDSVRAIPGSILRQTIEDCSSTIYGYTYVESKENEWGAEDKLGNWSGLVGVLQRNEADFAIDVISCTYRRLKAVDCSYPYIVANEGFTVRKPLPLPRNFVFVRPFQIEVWIATCVTMMITPIFFVSLNLDASRTQGKLILYRKELFRVFSTFLNQGSYGRYNERYRPQILLSLWIVAKCVLVWGYSGVFLAFLTMPSYEAPIDTIEKLRDAVMRGNHRLIAEANSSQSEIFKPATSGYLKDLAANVAENSKSAVNQISHLELALEPFTSVVFSDSDFNVIQNLEFKEKVMLSKESFAQDVICIAFRKGFKDLGAFNKILRRLYEVGILEKFNTHPVERMRIKQRFAKEWNLDSYHASDTRGKALSLHDLREVYTYVESNEGVWGAEDKFGNWNGLIGVLQRKEADFAIDVISCTYPRLKAVDFSYPYIVGRKVFTVRKPLPLSRNFAYVRPFQIEVWIAICITMMITPVFLILLNLNASHTEGKFKLYREELFRVFSTFVNQGSYRKYNERYQQQILLSLWIIAKCVLVWGYSGVLLAVLTMPSYEAPIDTIEKLRDAVMRGNHRVMAMTNSTNTALFKEATSGYLKDLADNVLQNSKFVLNPLSQSEFALEPHTSVVLPDYSFNVFPNVQLKEKVMLSKESFAQNLVCMAFRKGFKNIGSFSKILQRLYEVGIIQKFRTHPSERVRIKQRFARERNLDSFHANDVNGHALSLHDLQEVFLMLLVGLAIACVLMFLERGLILQFKIMLIRKDNC